MIFICSGTQWGSIFRCSSIYFCITRLLRSTSTARTRLESRTRDSKLDHLAKHTRKLRIIMDIHELMKQRKTGPFVSLQIISRWKHMVGLNVAMGRFVHKYPHVFEVFLHPIKKNVCCRITKGFRQLVNEESRAVRESKEEAKVRVKKLLLMSKNRMLHVHALSLIRRELGLPKDFRASVLEAHKELFQLVEVDMVKLVEIDENLGVARVEEWREREYREKWLNENETKYAFPINYPTGHKLEGGSREKMRNWQRAPYLKPYETDGGRKVTSFESMKFQKRVVGMIHEFLSLTVEKKMEVERFAHFKRDLGFDVNVRELLLKHPGIFYIATKGTNGNPVVFLRDSYNKGCLIHGNLIHSAREKMLNVVLLGCRCSKNLQFQDSESICKALTDKNTT